MRHEVPFEVKSKFDNLRILFGGIFIRAFEVIKKEDLVAIKRFLSAVFKETRNQLKDVKSMENLEEIVLDHTSFTDFPMLRGLACQFHLKEVEEELNSFITYRSEMYKEILAKFFSAAGINECVKDFQTKVRCG